MRGGGHSLHSCRSTSPQYAPWGGCGTREGEEEEEEELSSVPRLTKGGGAHNHSHSVDYLSLSSVLESHTASPQSSPPLPLCPPPLYPPLCPSPRSAHLPLLLSCSVLTPQHHTAFVPIAATPLSAALGRFHVAPPHCWAPAAASSQAKLQRATLSCVFSCDIFYFLHRSPPSSLPWPLHFRASLPEQPQTARQSPSAERSAHLRVHRRFPALLLCPGLC